MHRPAAHTFSSLRCATQKVNPEHFRRFNGAWWQPESCQRKAQRLLPATSKDPQAYAPSRLSPVTLQASSAARHGFGLRDAELIDVARNDVRDFELLFRRFELEVSVCYPVAAYYSLCSRLNACCHRCCCRSCGRGLGNLFLR